MFISVLCGSKVKRLRTALVFRLWTVCIMVICLSIPRAFVLHCSTPLSALDPKIKLRYSLHGLFFFFYNTSVFIWCFIYYKVIIHKCQSIINGCCLLVAFSRSLGSQGWMILFIFLHQHATRLSFPSQAVCFSAASSYKCPQSESMVVLWMMSFKCYGKKE